MKKQYLISGKTETPMPDLIISDGVENYIIDPFVGCVVGLSKFNNNLERINRFIDNLIGLNVIVDLDNCGYTCNAFIPYKRKDFRILKKV